MVDKFDGCRAYLAVLRADLRKAQKELELNDKPYRHDMLRANVSDLYRAIAPMEQWLRLQGVRVRITPEVENFSLPPMDHGGTMADVMEPYKRDNVFCCPFCHRPCQVMPDCFRCDYCLKSGDVEFIHAWEQITDNFTNVDGL